jgi:hypothetical protein
MSHQAIYRRFRPKTFDDVLGQEHVTRTLKNQIMTNNFPSLFVILSCFYISLLPSKALIRVTVSVYSMSPPMGIPCAIRVTFIPKGFISLDI